MCPLQRGVVQGSFGQRMLDNEFLRCFRDELLTSCDLKGLNRLHEVAVVIKLGVS